MSVEYKILIGYAALFAAVYLVVFAVLKFSKAKKKPKVAKAMASNWGFALIATVFVAMIHGLVLYFYAKEFLDGGFKLSVTMEVDV